jgi:hypothetical protein
MRPTLATFGTLNPPGSPASKYRLSAPVAETAYHQRKRDAAKGERQVPLYKGAGF